MTHRLLPVLCAALLGTAAAAAPLDLVRDFDLPVTAELLREEDRGLATMLLPIGPAQADGVPTRAMEGHIWRRSWRVSGTQTTLEVFAPLRYALQAAGFHVEYACASQACGGFAFRFGIDTIPAPDMSVRIADFEFLSASRSKDGRALSLLVSRAGGAVYVQGIERHAVLTADAVRPEGTAPDQAPDASPLGAPYATVPRAGSVSVPVGPDGLRDRLLTDGHVVLGGLEFQSGSAALTTGTIQSLKDLATLLRMETDWKVLIVGHTDTVGALDANVVLSRRRAIAVRQHLIEVEGMDSSRFEVAGAGYMAPLTQNATADGREENRRVEVVLITP